MSVPRVPRLARCLIAGFCLAFSLVAGAALGGDPAGSPPKPPPDGASYSELQEGANLLALEITKERERAATLDDEEKTATARMEAIPGELAHLTAALAKLSDADADAEALAERAKLNRERAALETEADGARVAIEGLAKLRRATEERIEALTGAQERWRKAADSARATEAKRAEQTVRDSAADVGGVPALKALAAENLALAERRAITSLSVAGANQREAEVKRRADRLRSGRLAVEQRARLLEKADLGIDRETGDLLRAQRSHLPSLWDARGELREHVRRSAEAALDKLSLQQERDRKRLGDIPARAAEVVASAKEPKPHQADVEQLLSEQRDLYEQLATDLEQRSAALANASEIAQASLEDVEAYARFLDERLLWIGNTEPIGLGDFGVEGAALKELAGATFSDWLKAMGVDIKRHALVWVVWVLALAALIWRRKSLGLAIDEAGAAAARRNCQSFRPTGLALGATLLHSLPLPLFFGFLAWRSYGGVAPIAVGCTAVALFALFVSLARCCARPGGVIDAHFRFGEKRASLIHRHLGWALPVGVVVIFLGASLQEVAPPPAGRIALIAALLMLMAVLHCILRPGAGLVLRKGKPTRLANLWHIVGVGFPAALMVGAALGYLASVQTLRMQAIGSLWLFVGIFFVAALLLRWALVSRRRLAVAQALERREAAAVERSGEAAAELPSLEEVRANAVNVVEVEEQSARLVHLAALVALVLGLWGIWAQTLPALSFLDEVALWDAGGEVPAESSPEGVGTIPGVTPPAATESDAKPIAATETPPAGSAFRALIQPTIGVVSLGDLIVAVLWFVLTFGAARNIPGLLELTVLRRLNLPPGGSFAFTTCARYLIVVVGVVIAFGKIGITWSKVQWIAAAITLGVGFGLKEVFANFVAGIILLFERPFRVGDVITVGNDVSGKVTDVNMRSTTIRLFNSRELIVPNMEFITGQLVNWTLSDGLLRIEIPVGIAYGSDTDAARDLLLKLAKQHPNVLAEPAPQVVFAAFGDSALNFELRVHVGHIDHNLATKNELFFQIDDAFREAGIEIAFPQTDIHIRSMPEPNDEKK